MVLDETKRRVADVAVVLVVVCLGGGDVTEGELSSLLLLVVGPLGEVTLLPKGDDDDVIRSAKVAGLRVGIFCFCCFLVLLQYKVLKKKVVIFSLLFICYC